MNPRTVHRTLCELLNTPNAFTLAVGTQALLTVHVFTCFPAASLWHSDTVLLGTFCIAR
jgi:hypothetical protein